MASSLARHRWTLERFGLSPAKYRYRILNPGAPRVFCVSIPKAGTHLLERALCLHPKLYRKVIPTVSDENIGRFEGLDGLLRRVRPGQVIVSHLRFRPIYPDILSERGARGIFLIRDPRDIVVSQAHYVSQTASHRHHALFAGLPGVKERLRLAIAGDPEREVASIRERLDAFRGWLDVGSLVVRFEDLVGPGGGSDLHTQRSTVGFLYEHLGLDADDELTGSVCARLFSATSPTFRKGSIGQWRSLFDPELESLMHEVAGDAALPYGYRLSADT